MIRALSLSALFLACTVSAYNYTALLNDSPPSGKSYGWFEALVEKSTRDITDTAFDGAVLAFDDAAFTTLATTYMEYADEQAFLDSLDPDQAAMIVDLHVLTELNANTTMSSSGEMLFASALTADNKKQDAFLVKVVNDSDSVSSFVFPTKRLVPDESSDESSSDASSTDESSTDASSTDGSSTEDSTDAGTRRSLLSDHSANVSKISSSDDGANQVYFIESVLVPMFLINMRASKEDTIWQAIQATPSLSVLEQLIDSQPEIRDLLNATGTERFNGTLFAPHDDAFHSLFSSLETNTADFAENFPRILGQMLNYHVLPFAFDITALTKPGNGLKESGRGRKGGKGNGGRSGSSDSSDSDTQEEGADSGNGNSNNRRLHQDDSEESNNRFQSNKPGAGFDLNVIKTGTGRIMIRGRNTQVELMSWTGDNSQISIADNSYMHIIDGVLRFSNIATDATAEGLFGANSKSRPAGRNYDTLLSILPQISLVVTEPGWTFIAPSEDAFGTFSGSHGFSMGVLLREGNAGLLDGLMKNHMVQVSSEDDLLNNTVYNTKGEDNVRINVDEDTGAISLTPTSDDVTSGSKRRSLLETSSSGVETIAQTADGSQIYYSDGVMVSSSMDGQLSTLSSGWKATPFLGLLVTATVVVIAMII